MTSFYEFFIDRLAGGGFSTEDTLASFLPLLREVVETHDQGWVAPLEGLDALRVDGNRIWFEQAARQPLRSATAEIRRVESAHRGAVDVVYEGRRTTDVDAGSEPTSNLAVGDRGDPVTRPIYLPGYVTWEHALGHHDPVTDVLSLGLILASLACGCDLSERNALETFVAARGNLFAIAENLHPVLAQAIVRMTDVDRHRRPQDLSAVRYSLENYRDLGIDLDVDLARIKSFHKQDPRTKQHVVLSKLKQRLFDITRRNRLLHFRPTMHTVNLTHASIPLSFDLSQIRPDQILTWNDGLQRLVARGAKISLNKYLNFKEALYLPSVLNRILTDARRDQSEFGFAQLRLVACFLHWTNLKENPVERYESPLVLIPVRLIKKKGIQDTYLLEPLSSEAEVNPVIRHQFKQLYAIDLPETIDLTTTTLSDFYEELRGRIEASDRSLTLRKVDRPRVALIHDMARRKLDRYRRRAKLAGRGVRSFLNVDYSYDPANYQPLGIQLYSTRVRPPATHLRDLIEERPRPRSFALPEDESPVVERKRSFFRLEDAGGDNPYVWSFDLCSVTLANFKYRRMSLIRDYDALLENRPSNPAFEATFSLVPWPVVGDSLEQRSLDERFDVVPCDPTQAAAVEASNDGRSYIIQGPPGTGKSQTITNLIADFVARGKRVLFVCEKRAAIDVVFARLKQCGLGDLCCLIHDSQADKRGFVMGLKRTYESFLEGSATPAEDTTPRPEVVRKLRSDLEPLAEYNAAMLQAPDPVGVPVRTLLTRCLTLKSQLPQLDAIERERLPDYAAWEHGRPRIERYSDAVTAIEPSEILACHPLHLLSPQVADADRPIELVATALAAGQRHCTRVEQILQRPGIAEHAWNPLARARQLVNYARLVRPLAELGQIALLDRGSERAEQFAADVDAYRDQSRQLGDARVGNAGWKHRIPASEVPLALEQARQFEANRLPWLRLSWWRLRSAIRRSYDFSRHVVRPSWSQVLAGLEDEYAQSARLEELGRALASTYGIAGDIEALAEQVAQLRVQLPELPDWLLEFHAALLASEEAEQIVASLVEAGGHLAALQRELEPILDPFDALAFDELRVELDRIEAALDELPDYIQCLGELRDVPDALSAALRQFRCRPSELEAAIADRSLAAVYRSNRPLARFDAATRDRHANRLEATNQDWLIANAAEVRARARQRFLEHVHVAGLPAAQLTAEQKEFKKRYNRGRRELEHEFGKSMRYKPIRQLVTDESGDVVKDLKPIWLMSPLSVSDTLPLDTDHVDVVIFDEASQITLEESVPSLFRAAQAIVVGDEMQLPPTDFFSVKPSDEEGPLLVEEDGDLVPYDLDSNSFLNHAARNLPSTMLGWHYRSRSESLISFSNWRFYEGRLLTVPEEHLPPPDRAPLIVANDPDVKAHARELLARPISFHFMEHGVYEKRRNRIEAEYIASLVRELLADADGKSLGVVAFSEAQQEEIEIALQRLAGEDKAFQTRLDEEFEREEDGQFVGLLVKNLENIQGDERDVIILSVCYGPDPLGKVRMNFGPINKSGGEKRLNVAFSRAKSHMAVVSSIRHEAITNEYNDGANCLKNYLRYAAAVSVGDLAAADGVLRGMSRWKDPAGKNSESSDDPLVEQIAAALRERGFLVEQAVGQSNFRCDLAVRREADTVYRLGIRVDNTAYYDQHDLLERDMMRPRLLRAFGWKVTHVLAKEWYADRDAVVDRLVHECDCDAR